jgi:hypothetical protein
METEPKQNGRTVFVPINVLDAATFDSLTTDANGVRYGKTATPVNILPIWEIDGSNDKINGSPSENGV